VLFLLLPLYSSEAFQLQRYEYIAALTLVAIGLNIALGFAGQLALGPSGIFGVAGYAAAVFADHYANVSGLLVFVVIGVIAASAIGLAVGIPALRVGGFYLGMATLAVALLVPTVAKNLEVTGADQGITLLANLDFTPRWSGVSLYYLSVAILAVAVLGSWLVLHSRMGQRFQALASSEDLAASLGVVGYRTKLLAFVVSAWPAGVGAALYLYTQEFFVPNSAGDMVSIYVLAACVIGGLGTIMGPLIGGVIVFGLNQFLGSLAQWQDIVFGALLVGFAILAPEGIVGLLERGGVGRQVPAALDVRRWFSSRDVALDHGERPAHRRKPSEVVSDPGEPSSAPPRSVATADLVLSGLVRSFGGLTAVDDVNMVVQPGRVHALIGSNGSGKTTILNLVSGFYRLDAGSIELGSTRLDKASAASTAHHGIGRTFQAPKLIAEQTLQENVHAAAAIARRSSDIASVLRFPAGVRDRRAARRAAREAISQVGLSEYADVLVSRLPHGLRRLGEVARSLAGRPGVLLLDEPAAGLTHSELDLLAQVIRKATDRGVAVLLVEHNVPFVFRLADEVTVLHLGRILAQGPPEEIRSDENVARAFLGSQVELIDDDTTLSGKEAEHG
jgi:ABC-type branched-subunit amino acid transport system ATPase component/ABC-type branched-subunit amino acid transport system permease subunit